MSTLRSVNAATKTSVNEGEGPLGVPVTCIEYTARGDGDAVVDVKGGQFGVGPRLILEPFVRRSPASAFERRERAQNERGGFPTATVTPHSVYLLVTLFWYFVTSDVGHEAARLIRSVE